MLSFILFIAFITALVKNHNLNKRLKAIEERLGMVSPSPASTSAANVEPATSQSGSIQPTITSPSLNAYSDRGPELNFTAVQWFTGIGVIALVLGMGFYLKYAIDQGWISETMRVVLGVVAGGLLVWLGELWHKKYSRYAHGLIACGVAIIYFSVFAAQGYYHLISSTTAFIFTTLLSLIVYILRFRYASKAYIGLSLLGAYLAPLLFLDRIGEYTILFPYLSLLTVVTILVEHKEKGIEWLFFSVFGLAVNYVEWASGNELFLFMLHSGLFLGVNALLYFIASALLVRKKIQSGPVSNDQRTLVGFWYLVVSLFFSAAFWQLLSLFNTQYLPFLLALCAVLMLFTYALINRLELKGANYILALGSAGLLIIAIAKQFNMPFEPYYLIALALIGVSVGRSLKWTEIRLAGAFVSIIAALQALVELLGGSGNFLLNGNFVLTVAVVALWAISGSMYKNIPVDAYDYPLRKIYYVLALALFWFGVSVEIITNFGQYDVGNVRNLLLSLWWLGYAVALAVAGGLTKVMFLRKLAVTLFVLVILKVFLYDVSALETGYRIVSFIALGVILLVMAYAYQHNKDKIRQFIEIPTKT